MVFLGPKLVVEGAQMLGAAQRLAARLGLSGFFGLDFMIQEQTGATYLIEMNPRCTPLCHLQLGPGRDLVGALWAQLSNQPYRPPASPIDSDLIAYFPQAWITKSTFLDVSYQDVPHQDPGLSHALLNRWPERSLLGRLVDHIRSMKGRPSSHLSHVFPEAIPSPKDRNDQDAVGTTLAVAATEERH